MEAELGLQFDWRVECWEAERLCLKFDFHNASAVTSTSFGQDEILVKILQPEYFVSAISQKQANPKPLRSVLPISPQLESKAVAQAIDSVVNSGSTAANSVGTSNLLVAYLLGASKQQLWSLMNTMQLVIYSAMANINFPGHTSYFFAAIFQLAKMDLFSAENFFAEMGMLETKPYSPKLEEVGFETMNFLVNSGSFFIFLILLLLEYVGRRALLWICKKFARYRLFRKVGILIDDPTLLASMLRLIMQSYVDIFICTILQLISFSRSSGHWLTSWDVTNSSTCLLCFLVLIAMPLFSLRWLNKNQDDLSEEDEHGNYWPLYESVRVGDERTVVFHIVFIARRIALASMIIFWKDINVFQSMGFLVLSSLNFVYLYELRPFYEPKKNRQEVINEMIVYLCSYAILALLNAGTSQQFRDQIGWVFIGLCVLSMAFNFYFVAVDLLSLYLEEALNHVHDFRGKRQAANQFIYLENQIMVHEAETDEISSRETQDTLKSLRFQRDDLLQQRLHAKWYEERKWCRKHGIDFEDWPIEREYKAKGHAIQYFSRLREQRLREIDSMNRQLQAKETRFETMKRQIRSQVRRRETAAQRLNKRLQWLLDLESQGGFTLASRRIGEINGYYFKKGSYSVDPTSGKVWIHRSPRPNESMEEEDFDSIITEEDLNLKLCRAQLELIRSHKGSADLQIEARIQQFLTSGFKLFNKASETDESSSSEGPDHDIEAPSSSLILKQKTPRERTQRQNTEEINLPSFGSHRQGYPLQHFQEGPMSNTLVDLKYKKSNTKMSAGAKSGVSTQRTASKVAPMSKSASTFFASNPEVESGHGEPFRLETYTTSKPTTSQPPLEEEAKIEKKKSEVVRSKPKESEKEEVKKT